MASKEVRHKAKLQEWRQRIMECRSSGRPVSEWCREHGVGTTAYYRWEQEIFGKEKDGQGLGSTPVSGESVFAELPLPKCGLPGMPAMTIRMGDMEIDIQTGANAEMLASLLRVLKQC